MQGSIEGFGVSVYEFLQDANSGALGPDLILNPQRGGTF